MKTIVPLTVSIKQPLPIYLPKQKINYFQKAIGENASNMQPLNKR